MKNKTLYIFFSVALISVVILVWKSSQQPAVASSTNPELLPVKNALFELHNEEGFKQLTKTEKRDEIYKVLDRLPPEYKTLKRQYQIAMGSLPGITVTVY
jgi:hypothetical protein